MSNIIPLQIRIRKEAATSVESATRDIAAEIRSGRFDRERLMKLYENEGFAEWFRRQGLALYRSGVLGSRTDAAGQ